MNPDYVGEPVKEETRPMTLEDKAREIKRWLENGGWQTTWPDEEAALYVNPNSPDEICRTNSLRDMLYQLVRMV